MEETQLPVLDEEILEQRFAKLKPRLTDAQAVIEASRCLFCHDAPCIKACPTGIDVPLFIRQIMSKNPVGSATTIFSRNMLGRSCGDVCPTEVLCEGACVYHGLNAKPIEIGRLQAYATDHVIKRNIRLFERGASSGKKVAVVGGGPAGLACAHELSVLGHAVTLYEASAHLGGLNAYGVAPYKCTNAEAEEEGAYLARIGFAVQTGQRLTSDAVRALLGDVDAVFVGIGLGTSRRLGIPGEEKPQVVGAAEFIYRLRAQAQRIAIGRRVVVIGAGNTAIDAAVESAKLGAAVTMIYRRTPADQSAYFFEVELARRHGVTMEYLTAPVAILGDGVATGVACCRNEAHGTTVRAIAGSDFVLPCDMVIMATGQARQTDFFRALGLALDGERVHVNAEFQTSVEKIFAGGDCVNGGKEVVNAVAHGRDAARGIDRFLQRAQRV